MICEKIIKEIKSYKTESVDSDIDGYSFSTYKLLRRIALYKNQIYPTGKFDSQGNYKYWNEIIVPRRNSEIKSIDFDTKDIQLFSEADSDSVRVLLVNYELQDWLHTTGQAHKLNSAIEQGTEWGSVVWKKIKNDYKLMELTKLYVLNQTAMSLDESDVIECEVMTSNDLRKKIDVWDNVEELIKLAKPDNKKTSPEFYIYEENGEISEKEHHDAKGKDGGREDKYILAKVIVGGVEKDKPTIKLFCEEIDEKPYKEYHRSPYSGRWLRVGMYELLMDIQTRANEIGNQIARGLEWASKTIFSGTDSIIAQNILTDLQNGDYIKGDIKQVEVRMQGLDQLVADWNRLMTLADQISNSFEIVRGETMPSGTPFSLANRLDLKSAQLFDYIREKLGIAFQSVIEDWVLPELLKNLNKKEIIKLTGDANKLNLYYQEVVNSWYVRNLLSFPPHDEQMAIKLKEQKLQELIKNDSVSVKLEKEMWKDFDLRARVNIVGENYKQAMELEDLKGFIQLESDPMRRTALIERAMKIKNIDVSALPKTPPPPPQPEMAAQPNELDKLLTNQ